jgi:hypothetical protein
MEKFTSCLFFVAVVVGVMDCPLNQQKSGSHLCGYSKPIEIQIIVHNLCVFLIVKHSVSFYTAKLANAQGVEKCFARFFLIVEYCKKTSATISFTYD